MQEEKKNEKIKTRRIFAGKMRMGLHNLQTGLGETFGLGRGATLAAVIFTAFVLIAAGFWFFYSAPPATLVMTSGDEGSLFQRYAKRYAKILEKKGVKLVILPSAGSMENLRRLQDPSFRVDVGFVQSGMAKDMDVEKLVSLGSVSYEPLYLFYRADRSYKLLSDFSGQKVAVGEKGTGTNVLALALLALNGIKPGGPTALLELDDEDAEAKLLEGSVDGVFMMGDSASSQTMRDLLRRPEIKAFHYSQAEAYARWLRYLNKVVLLEGSVHFGRNVPDRNIQLVSPTVEIIAREGLHPALSDLLLEAATEVHGRAGRYQRQGEFPAPIEHEYRISADAQRYYKSGKSLLYRSLPFWMASFLNRILVVFVPMILVLIPGLKLIPVVYRWRMRLRILRWYRALLVLESNLGGTKTSLGQDELMSRLDEIEQAVNHLKVPASFADQFYFLRSHISIVRARLTGHAPT